MKRESYIKLGISKAYETEDKLLFIEFDLSAPNLKFYDDSNIDHKQKVITAFAKSNNVKIVWFPKSEEVELINVALKNTNDKNKTRRENGNSCCNPNQEQK